MDDHQATSVDDDDGGPPARPRGPGDGDDARGERGRHGRGDGGVAVASPGGPSEHQRRRRPQHLGSDGRRGRKGRVGGMEVVAVVVVAFFLFVSSSSTSSRRFLQLQLERQEHAGASGQAHDDVGLPAPQRGRQGPPGVTHGRRPPQRARRRGGREEVVAALPAVEGEAAQGGAVDPEQGRDEERVAHVEEQELVARGSSLRRRRRLVAVAVAVVAPLPPPLPRCRLCLRRGAAPRGRQRHARRPRGVEGHEAVRSLADELVAALGEGGVFLGERTRRARQRGELKEGERDREGVFASSRSPSMLRAPPFASSFVPSSGPFRSSKQFAANNLDVLDLPTHLGRLEMRARRRCHRFFSFSFR